jgi:hypothetical protein
MDSQQAKPRVKAWYRDHHHHHHHPSIYIMEGMI